MHNNFIIIYRTNVKRFPPRLSKLKLPTVNIFKRPPKTVYHLNSAPAETMRPLGEKQVNYDVMIAPGNSFELVTNNIDTEDIDQSIEEPEYSFIVDMSGELPSSGLNFNKHTSTTTKSVITTESVPDTLNTEIVYGSPGPDGYMVPDPVILDNSHINQDQVKTKTPPSSSSNPMYKPTTSQSVDLKVKEQDLQEGFIPSAKQYIHVFRKEKNKTSEKLQKQADIILQPVIESTYEQELLPVSIPVQSQRLQFDRPALFPRRPSSLSSPQPAPVTEPLPAFQSQFQALRSLANLRRPPTFQAEFRDVSQDFRALFPRQFSDEADFQGFPLSQIYPSSLMSNIASFNTNTDLVDSEWLLIFV